MEKSEAVADVAENLWLCFKCAEYLRAHPTNIQDVCFEHMCEDLHNNKVAKRIDEVIQTLLLAKAQLEKGSREAASVEKNQSLGLFDKWLNKYLGGPVIVVLLLSLFILAILVSILTCDPEPPNFSEIFNCDIYLPIIWLLLQSGIEL